MLAEKLLHNCTDNNQTGISHLKWSYGIVTPTFSIIGLIGNFLILYLLSYDSQGKLKAFVYKHIKVLALIDIFFLICNIQVCAFILTHLFLTTNYIPPRSKVLAAYVWNVLHPTWMAFARMSDLTILLLTIDRYKVMKNIDQLRLKALRKEKSKKVLTLQVVLIFISSFVLQLPYFFQYQLEPGFCTSEDQDIPNDLFSQKKDMDICWCHVNAYKSSDLFTIYGPLYQISIKILPTFLVLLLNVEIWKRLRKAWNHRRRLKASITHISSWEKSGANSVSTISKLILAPQIPGLESAPNQLNKLRRLLSRASKTHPAKKKLIFSLPTKATTKELRITMSLFIFVFVHIGLTMPHTCIHLFWTTFESVWITWNPDLRVFISSLTDALMSLNFSLSFAIHFMTNEEIRQAFKDKCNLWTIWLTSHFRCLKSRSM